jgi:hypothetical protein
MTKADRKDQGTGICDPSKIIMFAAMSYHIDGISLDTTEYEFSQERPLCSYHSNGVYDLALPD